jgi:chromosome segregation ATPase
MKKLLSAALTMALVLSIFTTGVHAADTNYDKVLNDVNNTNMEINAMIKQAVKTAEQETKSYSRDIEVIQYGNDIVNLKDVISNLKAQISNLDVSDKDYQDKHDKLQKQLNEKEAQMPYLVKRQEYKTNQVLNQLDALQLQLDGLNIDEHKAIDIKSAINKLEAQIDKTNKDIQDRTDKFNNKIDKIISDLIGATNKKASDMKNRAAHEGFEVNGELIVVQISGQTILVDPLRVVGY